MKKLHHLLILCVFLLCSIGILMVFEASATESIDTFGNKYTLTLSQIKWLGLGLLALGISSFIPAHFWKKISPFVYVLGIILLFAIFIPGIGVSVNGAQRWVSFFGFRFQPVEAMKFGVVLFFANWLSKHQRLGPFLSLTLLPVALVMIQPDLGSTLILLAIASTMYFTAEAPMKILLTVFGLGMVGLVIIVLTSPYRMERVRTYLNPELDPLGQGYHVRQITIALGNGGLFGTGLGQSKQKFRYIPELSTDSIFAIIAEETGFIGSLFFISIYVLMIWICFELTAQLPTQSFERLCAAGISIWLASQTILNLGAVVALVPLTGIPLPLISRGGTSLVTILVSIGILISLTKMQVKKPPFSPRKYQLTPKNRKKLDR